MQGRQAALERQDLSCTYLAHHELESLKCLLFHIGPKRMRAPQQQQQQQPETSSAFANPSSEIARQQQMLRQQHSGVSSPSMVPSSPFGGSAHQDSDPAQLHMGPATSGRLHCCFLPITHPSAFITRHSSLVTHHSSLVTRHSSPTLHYSPLATHHSPSTHHSVLPTHHILLVIHQLRGHAVDMMHTLKPGRQLLGTNESRLSSINARYIQAKVNQIGSASACDM